MQKKSCKENVPFSVQDFEKGVKIVFFRINGPLFTYFFVFSSFSMNFTILCVLEELREDIHKDMICQVDYCWPNFLSAQVLFFVMDHDQFDDNAGSGSTKQGAEV